MSPIEWAEVYQKTAAVCNWTAWDKAWASAGLTEDQADEQLAIGRWLLSSEGQAFEACPESSDGYRWVSKSETVECGGFRGVAHQGFSTREILVEMRPIMLDGRYQLIAK